MGLLVTTYKDCLIHLHVLISEGNGDSDEADLLRDNMDVFYWNLSKEEISDLKELSVSLYKYYDSGFSGSYEEWLNTQ